MIYTPSNILEV